MAKDITSLLKAAPGYLKGKVEDGETLVGEELNNDIVQFFVKLLALGGLTANGNYDNETNGYQLIDALLSNISSEALTNVTGGLKTSVINIGDWDMSATTKITVNHGLSDFTKVRGIDVVIRNDADTSYYELKSIDLAGSGTFEGGTSGLTSLSISLVRTLGGLFQGPTFAATSYNRGWIIFRYIP